MKQICRLHSGYVFPYLLADVEWHIGMHPGALHGANGITAFIVVQRSLCNWHGFWINGLHVPHVFRIATVVITSNIESYVIMWYSKLHVIAAQIQWDSSFLWKTGCTFSNMTCQFPVIYKLIGTIRPSSVVLMICRGLLTIPEVAALNFTTRFSTTTRD